LQASLFPRETSDLAVTEVGAEDRDGARVHDIAFAPSRTGERVKAFLVIPKGPGPFAGVLWAHWLGEPETTNRGQYLSEAVGLATKGVASLLVDCMWSTPDWYEKRVPEKDFENSIRQAIALRRAMDLLASRPEVDPKRLGYVGHDFGGMYGMLMAGTDRRARTYVFVAVAPSLSDWAFFANQPRSKVEYLRQNAPLELTDFLHQVDNASTLFQFANADPYVSRAGTGVLLSAARDPKERRFYDADHSMNKPEIARDRDAWLLKELTTALPAGGADPKKKPD
jgi:cephalosporin-C deacetylase-like acetyl esterase